MTDDFDNDEALQLRAGKLAELEGEDAMCVDDGSETLVGEENDEIGQARLIEARMPLADSLQQKTSLRANKWNELNRIARFARINPPTVLQGVIGGQQLIRPGDFPVQVANWGGEDSETLPITVTLAPCTLNNQLSIFAFGIVRFGTRGFLVEAEVDVGKGVQFTVSGSSCTIQIGMEAQGPDPVQVSGMLSFYPVTRSCTCITRTRRAAMGGGVPIATVSIPPFARSVVIIRDDLVNGMTVNFMRYTTILYSVTQAPGSALTFESIPLTNDVTHLEASRLGPPGVTNAEFIFSLSF